MIEWNDTKSVILFDRPPECFQLYFKTIIGSRKNSFSVLDTEMFALQNGVE